MVQRGGNWAGPQPAQAPLAVPNVTAHQSTASVPITVLLHNDPLLCGFNVPIKGLIRTYDAVYLMILKSSHLGVPPAFSSRR